MDVLEKLKIYKNRSCYVILSDEIKNEKSGKIWYVLNLFGDTNTISNYPDLIKINWSNYVMNADCITLNCKTLISNLLEANTINNLYLFNDNVKKIEILNCYSGSPSITSLDSSNPIELTNDVTIDSSELICSEYCYLKSFPSDIKIEIDSIVFNCYSVIK